MDGAKEVEATPEDIIEISGGATRWALRLKYATKAYEKVAPENKAASVPENKERPVLSLKKRGRKTASIK
jgi:hypothetical protein